MGTIEPKKGTPIGDALFTSTQQRVLALLFLTPDRSFYAKEIIRHVGGGTGAVQRELGSLADSGLVTVRRQGNQKHYQANPDAPIFAELRGIVLKTFGLAEALRAALVPFGSSILAAFVFGSVAKRSDTAASDVDLLVVSDSLTYADLFHALEAVSGALGRTVNPTIYTSAALAERATQRNAFVSSVLAGPKIWLMGDDRALAT